MTRQNKLRDGVTNLSGKYFTPSYICGDPFIYPGRAVQEVKDHLIRLATRNSPDRRDDTEQKVNLLIRDLC